MLDCGNGTLFNTETSIKFLQRTYMSWIFIEHESSVTHGAALETNLHSVWYAGGAQSPPSGSIGSKVEEAVWTFDWLPAKSLRDNSFPIEMVSDFIQAEKVSMQYYFLFRKTGFSCFICTMSSLLFISRGHILSMDVFETLIRVSDRFACVKLTSKN